jgi:hypothetical protein
MPYKFFVLNECIMANYKIFKSHKWQVQSAQTYEQWEEQQTRKQERKYRDQLPPKKKQKCVLRVEADNQSNMITFLDLFSPGFTPKEVHLPLTMVWSLPHCRLEEHVTQEHEKTLMIGPLRGMTSSMITSSDQDSHEHCHYPCNNY